MGPQTPKRIEAEVLFLNRHTCCICHERNKDVQMHHIDGDRSNNLTNNLAVLCLDCHSRVTGRRGLGRGYSALEVRRYKREWERANRRFDLPRAPSQRRIPKLEKQLFSFEVKRRIYDAFAAKDTDSASINQTFRLLEDISIFEGLNRVIIDQLQLVFALSALSDLNKPIALSRALPRYFAHLAGPVYVKMSGQDEKDVIEALETIRFMNELCVEQNKQPNLLRAFKNCISEFIEIAITYKNKRIMRKGLAVLKAVQRSCGKVLYKGDRRLPALARQIQDFLGDVRDELQRANLPWKMSHLAR